MISEEKLKIVINNYFKTECDVDTSIRKAFEKGFRIGVRKGLSGQDFTYGKWEKISSGMTPGGTPMFVCSKCGGSEHLHGVEYPRRKLVCDKCGCVNSYPWESTYEELVNPDQKEGGKV